MAAALDRQQNSASAEWRRRVLCFEVRFGSFASVLKVAVLTSTSAIPRNRTQFRRPPPGAGASRSVPGSALTDAFVTHTRKSLPPLLGCRWSERRCLLSALMITPKGRRRFFRHFRVELGVAAEVLDSNAAKLLTEPMSTMGLSLSRICCSA